MKIQHLIPILFLAAFCTVNAQTNNALIYSNILAEQVLHRSGVVRYPDGAPAAGVHVTFYGQYLVEAGQMKFPADYDDPVPADDYNYQDAITDKDGHYVLIPPKKLAMKGFSPNGPSIRTNHIMVRDFEKNFATVQGFPATTTNVDLVLQPAITLSGSVKNAEGAPLSGASVELRFIPRLPYILDMHPPFDKANEQGQYSIPALPQGIDYSILQNRAKGYGSSQVGVNAKDTRTNHYEFPALVPKHADRIVAGQVLDSDDKPVAGALVQFHGGSEQLTTRTKTDIAGKFFTDTVCEGEVRISASYMLRSSSGDPFGNAQVTVQAGDTNIVINVKPMPIRPMPIDAEPIDIRPR